MDLSDEEVPVQALREPIKRKNKFLFTEKTLH
jgi:hypothetical protein